MQTNRFSEFVKYIESLATSHAEIRHLRDNKSHFIKLDTDELDTSIQNTVGFPVLCLDRYSGSFSGDAGNLNKNKGLTLMILDTVDDPFDYDRIHSVWDKTEEIADDLIAKIYQDMKRNIVPGIYDIDLSSVNMEPASNRSLHLYGTIVTFSLKSKFCLTPRIGAFE